MNNRLFVGGLFQAALLFGQHNAKGCAFADFAAYADLAAVGNDDDPCDGQAQAVTAAFGFSVPEKGFFVMLSR